MKILFKDEVSLDIKTLVLPVFADAKLGSDAEDLDKKSKGSISKAIDSSEFTGKLYYKKPCCDYNIYRCYFNGDYLAYPIFKIFGADCKFICSCWIIHETGWIIIA